MNNANSASVPKKPHVCLFCGKACRYLCELELHLNSHTGEQPYECELCPAVFSDPRRRSRHVKNVHAPQKQQGNKSVAGKPVGGSIAVPENAGKKPVVKKGAARKEKGATQHTPIPNIVTSDYWRMEQLKAAAALGDQQAQQELAAIVKKQQEAAMFFLHMGRYRPEEDFFNPSS